MEDVGGRINCANLISEEWALLEHCEKSKGWNIPTDQQWLAARGVLALIEIRRGWKVLDNNDIILGWCQIRINQHGLNALAYRREGKDYVYGDKLSHASVRRMAGQ